jgi:hypothetical protein
MSPICITKSRSSACVATETSVSCAALEVPVSPKMANEYDCAASIVVLGAFSVRVRVRVRVRE